MGNWRTVTIEGTCAAEEVAPLSEFLHYDWRTVGEDAESVRDGQSRYGPLCWSDSLCGLGDWPAARMLVGGNLFEREFDPDDVARHLERCAEVAPSLAVKVHCGGDYESEVCVATVTLADGRAAVGEAEREFVVGASEDAAIGRLFKSLRSQRVIP